MKGSLVSCLGESLARSVLRAGATRDVVNDNADENYITSQASRRFHQ